jgi:hypothetical protein
LEPVLPLPMPAVVWAFVLGTRVVAKAAASIWWLARVELVELTSAGVLKYRPALDKLAAA